MAQFDVYHNRNARTKGTYPLLVDIQSGLLDELQTRAVIPLSKDPGLAKKPMTKLFPKVEFEGEAYWVITPMIAGIARRDLGALAGNLEQERHAILDAVDFLLAGW
jgi:toxin CcdB